MVNPRYADIDGVPCYPSRGRAAGRRRTWAWCCSAARRRPRPCGSWRRAARRRRSCCPAGFAEIDAAGAARQAELRGRRGRDAAARTEHDRRGQRRRDRTGAVGEQRAGAAGRSRAGGCRWSRRVAACSARCCRAAWRTASAFATLVATGNEADLDVCDVIEYLLDDERDVGHRAVPGERAPTATVSRVVAARGAERGKPLVVFKIGRSEAGRAVGGLAHRRTGRRRTGCTRRCSVRPARCASRRCRS